jgi:hypothetical protein
VIINPGYVEFALRRGFIATVMDLGNAPAADGYILEPRQDVIISGKNCQSQHMGIHQDPGPLVCPGDCGRPQDDRDKQNA